MPMSMWFFYSGIFSALIFVVFLSLHDFGHEKRAGAIGVASSSGSLSVLATSSIWRMARAIGLEPIT